MNKILLLIGFVFAVNNYASSDNFLMGFELSIPFGMIDELNSTGDQGLAIAGGGELKTAGGFGVGINAVPFFIKEGKDWGPSILYGYSYHFTTDLEYNISIPQLNKTGTVTTSYSMHNLRLFGGLGKLAANKNDRSKFFGKIFLGGGLDISSFDAEISSNLDEILGTPGTAGMFDYNGGNDGWGAGFGVLAFTNIYNGICAHIGYMSRLSWAYAGVFLSF